MGRDVRPRTVPRLRLGETFAALRYRNYRLWFFGQLVSLFGTWMQSSAQGFLVYELTGSAAYLGLVTFASGLPTWLFTLYGGVVADRVSRRALMVATQSAMMALAFILGVMAFLRIVQPWHIVALAFLLGVANAFDAPARQAFVLEMVDRADMGNAIALNATMFNTAQVMGPAAGGLAYALVGPAWCFVLNGLSFVAIIVGLLMMQLKPLTRPLRRASVRRDLGEGLRYVLSEPIICALIGLVGIASMFGIGFVTLMPAWAVKVLQGDATTNGLLMAARGLGATAGALGIASLGRFSYKGRLLTLGSLVAPVALLLFCAVRWLPLALLFLVITGVAQVMMLNLANVLVQHQVADELRGRVMGIYTLIMMGAMPIGGLLGGATAQRIGEPMTGAIAGLATLAAAVMAWVFLPRLRALE